MAKTEIRGAQIKDTDITVSDIADGAVTLAKMANLPALTIIGNNMGSSTVPLALTTAQVLAILGINPNAGGAYQRRLSDDLILADGDCLVLSGYLDLNSYSVCLDGDSSLEIL